MGHRAVIAIVHQPHADVFVDPWMGARVLDLLHAPPGELESGLLDLEQVEAFEPYIRMPAAANVLDRDHGASAHT